MLYICTVCSLYLLYIIIFREIYNNRLMLAKLRVRAILFVFAARISLVNLSRR